MEANRGNAFYCGAVVATYAAIHREFVGEQHIEESYTPDYFGQAMMCPGLYLGQISRAESFNLARLEPAVASYFHDCLEELCSKIQGKIPTRLTGEEQSEFTVGYHSMMSRLKNDAIAQNLLLCTVSQ